MIQCNYSATQNNEQITQTVDAISGETINYQYDSLKRLTSTSSSPISGSSPAAYTQTYQHDGFGNLTAKVLNGTTTTIAVNAATNRLSSASYDANGNMTSGSGATLAYDETNRVSAATETSGGIEFYGYSADNKRFYKYTNAGTEQLTLYGARGEKLGVYSITSSMGLAILPVSTNIWFAGKLIVESSEPAVMDRLGTNRTGFTSGGPLTSERFYPYGDEITSTLNDHVKFATYTRDSYTGFDYADQRYYASTYGRFNTVDPKRRSAHTRDPLSWNRYAYTGGDPINRNDPTGLFFTEDEDDDENGGGGWGGGGFDLSGWGYLGGFGGADVDVSPPGPSDASALSCLDTTGCGIVIDPGAASVTDNGGGNVPASGGTDSPPAQNAITSTAISSLLGRLPPMSFTATLGVPPIPGIPVTIPLSMIGVGATLSVVPQTGTFYLGPTFSLSTPGNSTGASLTFWGAGPGADPNQILSGPGSSYTFQPLPLAGGSIATSPGQPGALVGYTIGTKTPGSFSSGYSFCIFGPC